MEALRVPFLIDHRSIHTANTTSIPISPFYMQEHISATPQTAFLCYKNTVATAWLWTDVLVCALTITVLVLYQSHWDAIWMQGVWCVKLPAELGPKFFLQKTAVVWINPIYRALQRPHNRAFKFRRCQLCSHTYAGGEGPTAGIAGNCHCRTLFWALDAVFPFFC